MKFFKLRLCAILGFAGVCCVSVAELSTVRVVQNGHPAAVRYEQRPWAEHDDGGLFSDRSANVLYADGTVGSDDFKIEAQLVIDDLNDSNAAFVLNEYNFFGFSGYEGRLYVKGRILGTRRLDVSAKDLIVPGEPFKFVAERTGDLLQVSINERQVFETPFNWRWGGEFGFRCLRILDYSVTANFLSLEEYVMNSPLFGSDTGPLEITPVVLPEGENLLENNWHFGWPVATKAGDAMVVVFQRAQHHAHSKRPATSSGSTAVAVRSVDGGKSWSKPFDLERVIRKTAVRNPGAMRAIITSSKGTIVYIGGRGAFRSEDNGKSWKHYPDAFSPFDKKGVSSHNVGPKIIETANGELIAFSHVGLSNGSFPNVVWCWVSKDDGCSWDLVERTLPENFHALEPAACLIDDNIYVLGRYHHPEKAFNKETGLFSYMQMLVPVDPLAPVHAQLTNIHTTDAVDVLTPIAGPLARYSGFWSQDTADISYNPVTKRLEAIVTNRTGGGQGDEQDITLATLNLWSISPEDFRAGRSEWRFEATLFQRYNMEVNKLFDGMHPGASVIDEESGVQHIFIYLGYAFGPAGVFRITRPLDTSVVREWWESVKQEKTEEENMKARKYFAALGMMAALTNSAPAELVKEGLILQLDAGSMEMDGRYGLFWRDLSGSDHDLKVAASCRGSQIDTDGLNDLPVVEFDKAKRTRWQLDARKAGAFNVGEEGMTFFVVCKPDHFQGWQGIIQKGNFKTSVQEGYTIAAVAGGDGRFVTRAGTGSAAAGVQSAVKKPKSGFHVYSTILGNERVEGYLNGEEAVPFGHTVKYQGTIAPHNSLFVGGFDGAIAEILIYKRALSLDEVNRVNAYLSEKYALTTLAINKVD